MKICKEYRIVPTSHLILDEELLYLEDKPFDEKLNLWAGIYRNEEPVSVKVFSRYESDDVEALKVSAPKFSTVLSSLIDLISQRRLCREAVIWKRVSHPNVLRFIGVTLSKKLAVVYPGMCGDVLDYLKENREANPVKLVCCVIPTPFLTLLFPQLEDSADGLKYLHSIGLVHGDLQAVSFMSHASF